MLPFNANKRKGASDKRLFATFKPYGEQKPFLKKKVPRAKFSLFAWGLQGRKRRTADTEPNTFYMVL